MYDVVIVGGGPAGLSAALVLGRCRRRVVICDSGTPRNARARELHGYLTRDGIPPLALLAAGRKDLEPYGIEWRHGAVTALAVLPDGFALTVGDRDRIHGRSVLIATGVIDLLPPIPGLDACYGITAHHCPYCDGWEERDKRIAVIGAGAAGTSLALALRTWSDRVALCLNGRPRLTSDHRRRLAAHSVEVHDRAIAAVEHDEGRVRTLRLKDDSRVPCEAIFFSGGQRPQCELPRQLGCALTRKGIVKTDHLGQTHVPGLFVAGDASRDVQFAIVAAAEGAKAAVAINKTLQTRAGLAVPQPS